MTIQTLVVTVNGEGTPPTKFVEAMVKKVNGWNSYATGYSVSTRTKESNKLVITVQYDATVIRIPYHLLGGMTDEILGWAPPSGYTIAVS